MEGAPHPEISNAAAHTFSQRLDAYIVSLGDAKGWTLRMALVDPFDFEVAVYEQLERLCAAGGGDGSEVDAPRLADSLYGAPLDDADMDLGDAEFASVHRLCDQLEAERARLAAELAARIFRAGARRAAS